MRPLPGQKLKYITLYNALKALRPQFGANSPGFSSTPTQENKWFTFNVFEGETQIAQAVVTYCSVEQNKKCFADYGLPGDFQESAHWSDSKSDRKQQ